MKAARVPRTDGGQTPWTRTDHRKCARNHPRSEPGWTGASRGRCDKRLGPHDTLASQRAVVSVQRRHRDRIPVRRQRLLATECEPASHREGGVYHRDTVRFTSIDECFQTKARLTFRAWARSEAVLRKTTCLHGLNLPGSLRL